MSDLCLSKAVKFLKSDMRHMIKGGHRDLYQIFVSCVCTTPREPNCPVKSANIAQNSPEVKFWTPLSPRYSSKGQSRACIGFVGARIKAASRLLWFQLVFAHLNISQLVSRQHVNWSEQYCSANSVLQVCWANSRNAYRKAQNHWCKADECCHEDRFIAFLPFKYCWHDWGSLKSLRLIQKHKHLVNKYIHSHKIKSLTASGDSWPKKTYLAMGFLEALGEEYVLHAVGLLAAFSQNILWCYLRLLSSCAVESFCP